MEPPIWEHNDIRGVIFDKLSSYTLAGICSVSSTWTRYAHSESSLRTEFPELYSNTHSIIPDLTRITPYIKKIFDRSFIIHPQTLQIAYDYHLLSRILYFAATIYDIGYHIFDSTVIFVACAAGNDDVINTALRMPLNIDFGIINSVYGACMSGNIELYKKMFRRYMHNRKVNGSVSCRNHSRQNCGYCYTINYDILLSASCSSGNTEMVDLVRDEVVKSGVYMEISQYLCYAAASGHKHIITHMISVLKLGTNVEHVTTNMIVDMIKYGHIDIAMQHIDVTQAVAANIVFNAICNNVTMKTSYERNIAAVRWVKHDIKVLVNVLNTCIQHVEVDKLLECISKLMYKNDDYTNALLNGMVITHLHWYYMLFRTINYSRPLLGFLVRRFIESGVDISVDEVRIYLSCMCRDGHKNYIYDNLKYLEIMESTCYYCDVAFVNH